MESEGSSFCLYKKKKNIYSNKKTNIHCWHFRIVAVTLGDEDVFIPFDPPLVSKFGPICRCARIKGRNTAPVQVTAEKVSMWQHSCLSAVYWRGRGQQGSCECRWVCIRGRVVAESKGVQVNVWEKKGGKGFRWGRGQERESVFVYFPMCVLRASVCVFLCVLCATWYQSRTV